MQTLDTMIRTERRPAGFSLIELLVVIVVIVLLLGLIVASYRFAVGAARRSVADQTVANLRTAVETFRSEHGFLPPLVYDGSARPADVRPQLSPDPCGDFPVVTDDCDPSVNAARANVYRLDQPRDRAFLSASRFTGDGPSFTPTREWANQRYSTLTFAYYLTGALPADIDGVAGVGYSTPRVDGSFGSLDERRFVFAPVSSRTREPLFDAGGIGATVRSDALEGEEYREHGLSNPNEELVGNRPDQLVRYSIVDPNGRAYRYYRWLEPEGLDQLSTDEFFTRAVGGASDPGYIPEVLLEPELVELARSGGTDASIRANAPGLIERNLTPGVLGARYAVVGAGENGVFGTEAIQDILVALGRTRGEASSLSASAELRLRTEAWEDNAVELGR